MAVGDPVIAYFNATQTFQPAAGVSVVVLKVMRSSTATNFGFTNGTDTARYYVEYNGASAGAPDKFVITNTDYFDMGATASLFGFSGIQIQ